MMEHTCSYYCERPECIRAQRDELRDRLEKVDHGGAVAAYWIEKGKAIPAGNGTNQVPDQPGNDYFKVYTRPQDAALAERLLELAANAPAYSLTSPIKSDDWRDEAVRVMHIAADALGGGK